MKAFTTGSRAYGAPRPDSDTDLVIRADVLTIDLLQKASDKHSKMPDGTPRLQFGKLNIIACQTDEEYAAWKVGTCNLMLEVKRDGRGRSREVAIQAFDILREMIGIPDRGDSG